eukprot:CAMPEP_0198141060 /NCGR_PEP_ID=MMETSP1443-20131203/4131_1 /TAXON_ID=186043 /ORGANISM="Entomoneis sp., Strain CCMP2396" /LENGTH=182 /DNA_ID=CAMNT_0043803675 /DNA_START=119 /DNA_END=667 /DNA_ORIENTATION=+
MKRALIAVTASTSTSQQWRMFTANPLYDYNNYHIEASNAARDDCTQLVVTGPDVDGVLASMTIALALQGCSVVDLHAAKSGFSDRHEIIMVEKKDNDDNEDDNVAMIQDVFSVIHRKTGKKFKNEQLQVLAQSLLQALNTPIKTLGSLADAKAASKKKKVLTPSQITKLITIVPGNDDDDKE